MGGIFEERQQDVRFEIISKEYVPDVNMNCITYSHKKTGAEVLFVNEHLGDETDINSGDGYGDINESVLGIFFRTPPEDDTGLPHILEHSVLGGSRKYTAKEPIADLLRSSLQTFLNAMTFPDYTGYAFASINTKDFYNIMNVYLDAVFFPRAISDRYIFAQEGWRLQPVNGNIINETDMKSIEMEYSGVVYNEMKGSYPNNYKLLYRYISMNLFPDNAYFYDSGGKPSIIPDLSFENFVEFHKKYYHPSNAKIFVSGAEDKKSVMSIMDEYLKEFDMKMKLKEASKVSWQQKKYNETKKKSFPYPAIDTEEGHIVALSWLLNDKPMTKTEEISLMVLDRLLSVDTSILKKTLNDIAFDSWLDLYTGMLQFSYSICLTGVNESNVAAIEPQVLSIFERLAAEGFSDSEISATISSIEFDMREYNDDSKGISLMFATMSKWIYDSNSTDGLKFMKAFSELKEMISISGSVVFQDLLQKFFLDNTHRVMVHLYPSVSL